MMDTQAEWYHIKNSDELDSPALVIYPARVKENVRVLVSMVDDVARLRPHVKTHKTKEATELLLQAGVYKFKCATIAEAEMLGICDAPDVLLAYQPVGPKLKRFVAVIKNSYRDARYRSARRSRYWVATIRHAISTRSAASRKGD